MTFGSELALVFRLGCKIVTTVIRLKCESVVFFCVTQKPVKAGGVERLTDTSTYTGSHKERFDESGRGRGREGREDVVKDSGYVSSYKNEGTYDAKMRDEK